MFHLTFVYRLAIIRMIWREYARWWSFGYWTVFTSPRIYSLLLIFTSLSHRLSRVSLSFIVNQATCIVVTQWCFLMDGNSKLTHHLRIVVFYVKTVYVVSLSLSLSLSQVSLSFIVKPINMCCCHTECWFLVDGNSQTDTPCISLCMTKREGHLLELNSQSPVKSNAILIASAAAAFSASAVFSRYL